MSINENILLFYIYERMKWNTNLKENNKQTNIAAGVNGKPKRLKYRLTFFYRIKTMGSNSVDSSTKSFETKTKYLTHGNRMTYKLS